jgi:hypothetical protein
VTTQARERHPDVAAKLKLLKERKMRGEIGKQEETGKNEGEGRM